jgi:hypothetical protein
METYESRSAPPANAKQRAYLSYMGVTVRETMSQNEASAAITRLESVTDYEQWRQLVEKKSDWQTDRFLLHPHLFEAEFDTYYNKELPEILASYVRSQAPECSHHLTPLVVHEAMNALSAQNASWWRSPRRQDLFLTELLENHPAFRKGGGRALLRSLHHACRSAATRLRSAIKSFWSKGNRVTS